MYENKTYEALMQEKLAAVSPALDKREGSAIYTAMAPNSLEAAMLYVALDTILNETYADTASMEYLTRRCMERGISPLPATSAVGIGAFNIDVPIGSRFSLDRYNWVVTDRIALGSFHLTCETPGYEPSRYTGKLIPVEYISGLESAELTSISVPGEDAETVDELRLRYLNSFSNQSFSGNRAQYIQTVEAMPGVGQCKPFRAWAGPGTVKLVITDSEDTVPSSDLVQRVQTAVDPTQNHGDGVGLAPIDHEVTVVGVSTRTINITATLTYAHGYNLEECRPYIEEALDAYYAELNGTWSDGALLVRVAQIESALLQVEGVLDIAGTTLNGAAANLQLTDTEVAKRGAFSA